MKKAIYLIGAAALSAALLAGCGQADPAAATSDMKQSATAWLQEENDDGRISAKVDLTGGYSVEFASGAVYLYDQEIVDGVTECVAMAVTLDQGVFKEYMDEVLAEHRQIFLAFQTKDKEAASRAAVQHMQNGKHRAGFGTD